MSKIPRRVIKWLLKMLSEDHEVCLNLTAEEGSDDLMPHGIQYGLADPLASRKSCSYKYYSDYILHTHPFSSYAYPSAEDILKVLKNKEIKNSLIVTSWGIWCLCSRAHSKSINVERARADINRIIRAYSRLAAKGEEYPDINLQKLSEISEKVEQLFRAFGLQIHFTSWDSQKGDYYVK